jgi:hypothetical protein
MCAFLLIHDHTSAPHLLRHQEEYAELKAQEQRSAKKRAEIESQNKTLSQPLAAAEAEVTDLRHKVQHYEKDKLSLRQIKARLLVLEEQFRALNSEHGALQRRFATVQHERDMLHETFEQSLHWVQQRNAHSQQRLQHRLEDVQGRVEQKVPHRAGGRAGGSVPSCAYVCSGNVMCIHRNLLLFSIFSFPTERRTRNSPRSCAPVSSTRWCCAT